MGSQSEYERARLRKIRAMKKRRQRRIIRLCFRLIFLVVLIVGIVFGISKIGGLVKMAGKAFNKNTTTSTSGEASTVVADNPSDTSINGEGLYICLDPGHGGKDQGSSHDDRLEKDDCLSIGLKVQTELEKLGAKVLMTRDSDTYPTLEERCNMANEAEVDYFVSLHRNTGDGTGIETWVSYAKSAQAITLAESIMENLEQVGIQENRGVKYGTAGSESKDYFVNANANAASCIVELGFINNEEDNSNFDSKQDSYAKAIAEAIVSSYEANGEKSADSAQSSLDRVVGEDEATAETNSDEDQLTVSNTEIGNIESLDNTYINWGYGPEVDEYNRPTSALSYQDTYGSSSSDFIKASDDPSEKTLYLTFDEGYENGFTGQILDTLKEKDCPAVFFVTKTYVEGNQDLVKRMIDEGHILGNHSVTHPSEGLPSQTIEEQTNEVMELHNYIKEQFNYEMCLFRYPTGRFSVQSLALLNNLNYRSIFWSFAYYDYDVNNQMNHDEALNKMVTSLHPGGIYLLHAVSETNASVLGSFIDQARAEGYSFVPYQLNQ